jgi:methyltransferase (TIGR00027 family)
MQAGQGSRTAVLVCQGRAAADGRIAVGRFADPTALPMLRPDERRPVEQVRAGSTPQGTAARVEYEMVRASAEAVVPRTVAIDAAVRARPTPQVVILGAGLDGRAWRLTELAGAEVYEVDHPDSQRDKRERVAELTPVAGGLHWVAVDFTRDKLGDALEAAGHRAGTPTTWIWEGVVPYLTAADVEATVVAVVARSAPDSGLVVNYQAPSVAAGFGRLFARGMLALARKPALWRDEPRRSSWTPATMAALLARHGGTVTGDEDNLAVARRLPMEIRQRRSLENGRVATAVLAQ